MHTKNKKSGEYTAKTPTQGDVKVVASSKLALVSENPACFLLHFFMPSTSGKPPALTRFPAFIPVS
jgi:hypothetical protein